MVIPKGLLIGGGIAGAVGIGYAFLHHKSAPADAGTDPAGAAGGKHKNDGGGGLDGAGLDPTGQQQAGATGQAQGQQVGAYTLIPDQASGMQIVVETATQNPVGVVDQQGKFTPATLDAQGNLVPTGDAGTTGAATGALPQAGVGASSGSATSGVQPDQYETLAQSLFANAGNASVGSAASDPLTGQAALGATSAGTTGLGGVSSAATGAATAASAGQQVGPYTVIPGQDGQQLLLDTASQQPVGVLDAAGNITPVTMDASGQLVASGNTVPVSSLGAGSGLGAGLGATSAATTGVAAPTAPIGDPSSIAAPFGTPGS
jgi:hypothetical protein